MRQYITYIVCGVILFSNPGFNMISFGPEMHIFIYIKCILNIYFIVVKVQREIPEMNLKIRIII